ncbi:hypothetical protein JAAARDRAFT_136509 [Jaapia argillacea MUCL 33604]|uniref:Methyltransferase type 11 domain-containing protein n=1 Tax=Jaapia argillacea MUCL 33604 TaxID=933084 RepID=A0A067PJG3_9AGAM|nr:hypothetical protein JAAARDRAFT_136509 [Jaapia argillacea MUCL 33604]
MATFSRSAFNTSVYHLSRPTYPRQLYEFIFKHHGQAKNARWDTAVDLGCGTGQATTELSPFKHIIGVDPSAKMLDEAREATKQLGLSNEFKYIQSSAEDLSFLEDGSVDLIVTAQAGHWFDWGKLWPEAARVLRPGGSVMFWNYSEFRLTSYPSLTPLITAYAQGTDLKSSLGPYWQQPGRSILANHLLDIPKATDVVPDKFTDWQHIFFTGSHYPDLPNPLPVIMRKKMTWNDLLTYLRSWSSLHTFHEKYPEDLKREDGDIAVRFWKSLQEGARGESRGIEEDQIELEWPLALIMVRRS